MDVVRIVAWILVGLALMLLGADGISTLEMDVPVIRTTQEILGLFGMQVELLDDGAGKAINFLLTAPLWAITGIVGIVLTLVFRPID